MRKINLIAVLFLAAIVLTTIEGCARVHGCTDPNATNFNAGASVDNGTCTYVATFYFDQNGPNATVNVNNQTGTISTNYQAATPVCGTSALGCANFVLLSGTYNYTAASSLSNWNGSVTVSSLSPCALVDLQQNTGAVTFWTANNAYGTITININGTTLTLNNAISSGTPLCGASGTATTNLLPGTYNYTASATNGATWGPASVTITADGCQPIQFTP